MKSEITIQIKEGYRHHVPKGIFKAVNAKPGDYVKITVTKEETE